MATTSKRLLFNRMGYAAQAGELGNVLSVLHRRILRQQMGDVKAKRLVILDTDDPPAGELSEDTLYVVPDKRGPARLFLGAKDTGLPTGRISGRPEQLRRLFNRMGYAAQAGKLGDRIYRLLQTVAATETAHGTFPAEQMRVLTAEEYEKLWEPDRTTLYVVTKQVGDETTAELHFGADAGKGEGWDDEYGAFVWDVVYLD